MIKLSIISYIHNFNIDNIDKHLDNLQNVWNHEIEIIILNDKVNSSICKTLIQFQKKNNRISLIHSKYKLGMYNFYNKAIQISNGEYLLFMSSDFLLCSTFYENLCRLNDIEKLFEFKMNFLHEIIISTLIISKNILKHVGYFDTFRKYSDWDLKMRILKVFPVITLQKILIQNVNQNRMNLVESIPFKNYFSKQYNRLFVPIHNYIKINQPEFNSNIYSELDVIISNKETEIFGKQYISIESEGKYILSDVEEKSHITISDSIKNIIFYSDNLTLQLKKNKYTITYGIIDTHQISPIKITPISNDSQNSC